MINNERTCRVCKKTVFLDKDSYCVLEDYREGKFLDVGYYHNTCWHDRFSQRLELQKMAISLAHRANKMMDDAGYKEKDEEYVIT